MADEADARRDLILSLQNDSVLLLTGAGCSASVGYPNWSELVTQLANELAPSLTKRDESDSDFAGRIFAEIRETGNTDAYYNFLEAKFRPLPGRDPYGDYHLALVQLGFSGLVTTNYDNVIESAVMAANNSGSGIYRCETVDLCFGRSHAVFEFLRSLQNKSSLSLVLHLHGYYRNPENLILTSEDYRKSYGEITDEGATSGVVLDSLHRRVLWTLLTMHPVLFVGFGLEDQFFYHVVKMVQQDFKLGNDQAHFALMAYSDPEEREQDSKFLFDHNIRPIFYEVSRDDSGRLDYGNFRHTILELAKSIGVPTIGTGISEMNRRMLEL